MKLKARIRPLSRSNDEVDTVALELMNSDGSSYEGGGGGGGAASAGQILQAQGVSLSTGTDGGALLWGNPSVVAAGIDLSEYGDANEVVLPQGLYVCYLLGYFDPGIDDGADDQDRSIHLNLAGAPGDWGGPIAIGFDLNATRVEGGWAESMPLMEKNYPFVIWADHQTAQIYVTASAADPINFTVNFLIAKVGDLPA